MAQLRRYGGTLVYQSLGWMLALAVGCAAKPPLLAPAPAQRCTTQPGFVWVPGGEFEAGSNEQQRRYGYEISAAVLGSTPAAVAQAEANLRQRGWFDRESAATTLSLPGFCIAQHLVTQADYQQFVAATDHRPPGISAVDYQRQGFLVHPCAAVEPYLWVRGAPPVGRKQHPVVLISVTDAIAYARWKGQQDGVVYRIPTDLEWEKAARGPDGGYFPWGSEWRNDATNAATSGIEGTSPVGSFPLSRSPYGVDDMAGNVFEFTSTPAVNGTAAVMKGCSWDDLPGFCRAAYSHTRPTPLAIFSLAFAW